MEQYRLTEGPLLDETGHIVEAGYATQLVRRYDRNAIRANRLRIKEWDYYLVYNDDFGLALTVDDNGYMGLISCSFLDFKNRTEKTVSPMFFLPMGNTNLPPTSKTGDVEKHVKDSFISYKHESGGRRLRAHFPNFDGGKPLDADVLLTDEPQDTMVICTPWQEKRTAFYYNQKIIGMRAAGTVEYCGRQYAFTPDRSFGLLDWGRGVWTYENTWYWGAGQGVVDGHVIGFNIGYGFGDTSAASENMLFVDGKMHKLSRVTFHIPQKADGTDDFLSQWTFSLDDDRFTVHFTPFLDRASCTAVGPILSDQHQVFGWMDGILVLDDGSEIVLTGFTAFAEKVHNKW